MKVAKFVDDSDSVRVGVAEGRYIFPLTMTEQHATLADLISASDPIAAVESLERESPFEFSEKTRWLPPIDQQEVWAAGVTYKRSQTARMEESEAAASCYDQVYEADRPELFFKATPHRVAGHWQPLRIRADATWNVPEPEITLVLSPEMRVVGLTVGNDMSSRDIEGENPLYLPQAKCYDQCAGIGPWIEFMRELPSPESLGVHLGIIRDEKMVFDQRTDGGQMARTFDDLVGWLARDNSFPNGAFLMTGTGIVPTSDFTLLPGDVVHVSITPVGTLSSPIIQG